MVCQVCHRSALGRLCRECFSQLRPAPERTLPGGVRLVAAFEHEGPAKRLVHHLKYRGVTTYADIVAEQLHDRLPDLPVVPVPRAWSRRVKYGIDPALEIARRLERPVLRLLAPPIHSPRRAGSDHSRLPPRLRSRGSYPGEVIVLDDVVTSGATLKAAIDAIGSDTVRFAIAANAAPNQRRSSSSVKIRITSS